MIKKLKTLFRKAYKGKAAISEELIEKFGERCKDAIRKHFTPHTREWYIRPSALGRDIRLLQCDKLGLKKDKENNDFTILKFLWGDMCEAAILTLLEASGTKIESEQGETELCIGGVEVQGTYDVIIDGKLYDIKSASPYGFAKFKKGLAALQEEDAFGYIMQNVLYAAGEEVEIGGWIVINKVTGEVCVCDGEGIDTIKYLAEADEKVITLNSTDSIDDIDKEVPIVPELVRGNFTGKFILDKAFNFFAYKDILGWSKHLTKKPYETKYRLKED